MVKLSEVLIWAINHVNGDVAYEIEFEGSESDRERDLILAEVCIDAGRLETWGHPEAQKELSELIRAHGYPAVLAEVAKHVDQA